MTVKQLINELMEVKLNNPLMGTETLTSFTTDS